MIFTPGTGSSLVIFTSLPGIGGHTTATLKLVELLRDRFSRITIIAKEIPGHGTSREAGEEIVRMGAELLTLTAGSAGVRSLLRMLRSEAIRSRIFRADVFLSIGMRHLSPVLAQALRPHRSFYYHITHLLSLHTRCLLCAHEICCDVLVYLSPVTARTVANGRTSPWVLQPSELPRDITPALRLEGPIRFGYLARLCAQKGTPEMIEFAATGEIACELHVGGRGQGAERFEQLAAETRDGVRVFYYGGFAPTERASFYDRFFANVDYLVVATQDESEGLPTVILEALQYGVPVIATDSGGTIAFRMDELGPAETDVVRIVPKADIGQVLSQYARGTPPDEGTRRRCIDYYRRHFSDGVIRKKWLALLCEE